MRYSMMLGINRVRVRVSRNKKRDENRKKKYEQKKRKQIFVTFISAKKKVN